MFFLLGANTSLASVMTLNGINGSGECSDEFTTPRTFTGRTNAEGQVRGELKIFTHDGKWAGSAIDGKITGTWTQNSAPDVKCDSWVGSQGELVYMVLGGLTGGGTWEYSKTTNTFTGNTTDPDNDSAKGTWNFDGYKGNWEGKIKNGKIDGVWSGFFGSNIPYGEWVGKKITNRTIETGLVEPADTFATVSGKYIKGNFDNVYFKYGEDNGPSAQTASQKVDKPKTPEKTYTDYSFEINGLTPSSDTKQSGYYYKFCGTNNNTETCGDSLNFVTHIKGWNGINNTSGSEVDTSGVYTFLEPLSDGNPETDDTKFDANVTCAFADFANKFIKVFIAICALLAMVMIISGGIQYMTSELVSSEVQGKTVISQAILGLILAVSGYAILNTINPKLLNLCPDLPNATITTENFDVGGDITFDGKPIKVNFNKEAYPAAEFASDATDVETSLILAIFSQETGSGRNVGRCTINNPKANMYPEDKVALEKITNALGRDLNTTPVSCSLTKPNGQFDGHGGAIGLTQFRPATWLENAKEGESLLGHAPDPWNPHDAIMMTAIYLKKMGGAGKNPPNPILQKESACKYFGGPAVSCSKNAGINKYGSEVMGKKLSIEEQIKKALEKGEI